MNSLLVIADDLTGALDSAGRLAGSGRWVPVRINPAGPQILPPVSVIDLNTRHAENDIVRTRVSQAVRAAKESGTNNLYLKVDSTLRGPITESILTAQKYWNPSTILFCPAFPALRRHVVDNQLMVAGVPVNLTPTGSDLRNPVRDASLNHYVKGVGLPLHHLLLEQVRKGKKCILNLLRDKQGIWTADAQRERDLRLISSAAIELGITMMVGSAGLVKYILPQSVLYEGILLPPQRAKAGKVLFVVGSLHPHAKQQIRVLKNFNPNNGIVISADAIPHQPEKEDEIAHQLASRTVDAVQSENISAIVVVGGDTARAVVQSLGITVLLVGGEVIPGVPWAKIGDGLLEGITWVSKAGGFGGSSTLVRIASWL